MKSIGQIQLKLHGAQHATFEETIPTPREKVMNHLRPGNNESGRPRSFVTGHNTGPREPQIKFMAAIGSGSRLQEVAEKTGQSLGACKCMASKLVREQKLIRKGKGIYGKA